MGTMKFRAWHQSLSGLWSFVYFELFNTDNGWVKWDDVTQRDVGESVEYDLIEQFSGFCDKNNKDIYEGDVYHTGSDNLYVVKFIAGAFCGGSVTTLDFAPLGWTSLDLDDEPSDYVSEDSDWISAHVEVIANIHENPELFKE